MNQQEIIKKTIEFMKTTLENAEGGHDWWHTYRVWKLSKNIAKKEKANLFIVELGALLHDIADSKFHNNNEEIGPQKAKEFLKSLNIDNEIIEHIENIITNISFRNKHSKKNQSQELDIIQDADRLDALGAIGIARTINFGGYKNNPIYDPNIKPNLNMTKKEYKKRKNPTINHFYEKILLIKDKMNTNTGKKLAKHRHNIVQEYLNEFHKEWEAEL